MLETARKNSFRFDTVQMPINVLDVHYRSFEKEVLPLAQQEGTAVLGMKPLGSGLILESGAASALDCLRYAMSVPGVSVTITGCDKEGVFEQALWLATTFKPMAQEEKEKLLRHLAFQRQEYEAKIEKLQFRIRELSGSPAGAGANRR